MLIDLNRIVHAFAATHSRMLSDRNDSSRSCSGCSAQCRILLTLSCRDRILLGLIVAALLSLNVWNAVHSAQLRSASLASPLWTSQVIPRDPLPSSLLLLCCMQGRFPQSLPPAVWQVDFAGMWSEIGVPLPGSGSGCSAFHVPQTGFGAGQQAYMQLQVLAANDSSSDLSDSFTFQPWLYDGANLTDLVNNWNDVVQKQPYGGTISLGITAVADTPANTLEFGIDVTEWDSSAIAGGDSRTSFTLRMVGSYVHTECFAPRCGNLFLGEAFRSAAQTRVVASYAYSLTDALTSVFAFLSISVSLIVFLFPVEWAARKRMRFRFARQTEGEEDEALAQAPLLSNNNTATAAATEFTMAPLATASTSTVRPAHAQQWTA